jgi:hypothetical protein
MDKFMCQRKKVRKESNNNKKKQSKNNKSLLESSHALTWYEIYIGFKHQRENKQNSDKYTTYILDYDNGYRKVTLIVIVYINKSLTL